MKNLDKRMIALLTGRSLAKGEKLAAAVLATSRDIYKKAARKIARVGTINGSPHVGFVARMR